VYIHASGKLNREGVQWLRRRLGSKVPSEFQPSAIVAIAEISDVVTRKDARRFGAWFSRPYGIVLNKVRPLRSPVPTNGKLGLFRASSALKRRVERQLPAR